MSVTNRYFLAANGFSGFRSCFDGVINSEKLKKLYLIKGGSGVGKSTLMRGISSHFSEAGYSVEEILCSSDPKSLDGVKINSDDGYILLIDGTSPHEYDMKYPAVRDYTVDLSRHIDDKCIALKREKVVLIMKQKKKQYDFAYKNLHLAGIAYKAIRDAALPYARRTEIENLAKKLFQKISDRNAEIKYTAYSAFCKDGYISLDTSDREFERVYYFDMGYKSQILFSLLIDEIKKRSLEITIFPSPFSDDIVDGFSVDGGTLFKMRESAPTYKADCYFDEYEDYDEEMIRDAEKIYNLALSAAEGALKRAFENHAELEEIYGNHMNFEKNHLLSEELIAKISAEL